MAKQNARDYLIDLLDDYRNNYLSPAVFAEHNGLDTQEAIELLAVARVVADHKHPEE